MRSPPNGPTNLNKMKKYIKQRMVGKSENHKIEKLKRINGKQYYDKTG